MLDWNSASEFISNRKNQGTLSSSSPISYLVIRCGHHCSLSLGEGRWIVPSPSEGQVPTKHGQASHKESVNLTELDLGLLLPIHKRLPKKRPSQYKDSLWRIPELESAKTAVGMGSPIRHMCSSILFLYGLLELVLKKKLPYNIFREASPWIKRLTPKLPFVKCDSLLLEDEGLAKVGINME